MCWPPLPALVAKVYFKWWWHLLRRQSGAARAGRRLAVEWRQFNCRQCSLLSSEHKRHERVMWCGGTGGDGGAHGSPIAWRTLLAVLLQNSANSSFWLGDSAVVHSATTTVTPLWAQCLFGVFHRVAAAAASAVAFEHIWCQWCHHGPNCLWLLLILFICALRKNAQIWLANWQGSAAAIVFTGCYSLSLHTFLCRPIPTSVYQQQQQQQYSSTCLFLSFDISAAAASLIAAAVIAQWTTVVQNSIRSNRQWQ